MLPYIYPHIKKWLLVITLIVLPIAGFSQLSVDSLKNICINNFKQEILIRYGNQYPISKKTSNTPAKSTIDIYLKDVNDSTVSSLPGIDAAHLKRLVANTDQEINLSPWKQQEPEVLAEELFIGYFKDIVIFKARYLAKWIVDDGPSPYGKIYCLNTFTGAPMMLQSIDAFNALMDSAKKPIANLDKCYLYLLLSNKETQRLPSPGLFKKINTDVVIQGEWISLFNHGFYGFDKSVTSYAISKQVMDAAGRSTKRDIRFPMCKLVNVQPGANKIYQYDFIFDRHNDLKQVTSEPIKAIIYTD